MSRKIFKTLFTIVFVIVMFGFFKSNRCDFKTTRFLIAEWSLIYFVIMFYISNIWIQLFLGWALLRTTMMVDIDSFQLSYVSFNTMFFYCLAYQVFKEKIKSMNIEVSHILNILCVITLVHCFYMFMQNWGIWIMTYPLKYGIIRNDTHAPWLYILDFVNSKHVHGFKDVIVGQLGQANLNGAYLAMMLPAFFRKRWCYGIPFILMAIYLCQTLGGIISAFVVLMLFGWFYFRRYRVYMICIPLFIASLYILLSGQLSSFTSGSGRFGCWDVVFSIINVNDWIKGFGLGTFKSYSPQIMEMLLLPYTKYYQLHNEYMQCYFEVGIVSVLIICGFCVNIIRHFFTSKHYLKTIVIIGLLIGILNCGGIFLMHSTVAWLFLVYVAILDKYNEQGV